MTSEAGATEVSSREGRQPWRVRLAAPDLGAEELDAVAQVFASGLLTDGPVAQRFEAAFAEVHGTSQAVAFSSGTVALAAIQLGLGIGAGDEVIVPSITFISTATSVVHVGATPVFADVHADTFNLDPADVERRITPRTRAIIAVHYGGQAADLAALADVADRAGVALIEDAAEAHGATYQGRPVGGFGQAAMFSFTPTKNMTTGEGGMVTTNDPVLADRLRLLRNHGQRSGGGPVHLIGFNWRMSEIAAAIGEVQLRKLDAALQRRRRNAAALTAALSGIPGLVPPASRPDREHTFMLYTVLLDHRAAAQDALAAAGVESRVYFPPAHREPVLQHDGHPLPTTDAVADRMLSLPVHCTVDQEMLRALTELALPAHVR
jgi:perosamine synthetase